MIQQLDLGLEERLDLNEDFQFHLRSNTLSCRKKVLKDKLPEDQGAWAVFRYIHDNFAAMRWVNKRLHKDGLGPSTEYSQRYLEQRFPADPHVAELKPQQAKLITTYLVLFERLTPTYPTDTDIGKDSYFVHSTERFKR
jgi:hypothetical protein